MRKRLKSLASLGKSNRTKPEQIKNTLFYFKRTNPGINNTRTKPENGTWSCGYI